MMMMRFFDLSNPWKNAGIFLILANIVFFCSPNLVLFGSLFLIFFFSFSLLKGAFETFAKMEIKVLKTLYDQKYNYVYTEIDKNLKQYELFIVLPSLLSTLFTSFKTTLQPYKCIVIPRNTNYLFIYLERVYFAALGKLTRDLVLYNKSESQKLSFAEAYFKKIFG